MSRVLILHAGCLITRRGNQERQIAYDKLFKQTNPEGAAKIEALPWYATIDPTRDGNRDDFAVVNFGWLAEDNIEWEWQMRMHIDHLSVLERPEAPPGNFGSSGVSP
jgi:hypothetical protein